MEQGLYQYNINFTQNARYPGATGKCVQSPIAMQTRNKCLMELLSAIWINGVIWTDINNLLYTFCNRQ